MKENVSGCFFSEHSVYNMPFPIGGPLDWNGVSKSSCFRDIAL